jgi:hypothetical protein
MFTSFQFSVHIPISMSSGLHVFQSASPRQRRGQGRLSSKALNATGLPQRLTFDRTR